MPGKFSLAELANAKMVKNRFANARYTGRLDREELTWEPGEVKHLIPSVANFFVNRSTRKRDLKGKAKVQVLVILGTGKDESDLDATTFAGPQQLVEKQWFDKDGTPLKEKYIDVAGTGADQAESTLQGKEQAAQEAKVSEHRAATLDKVADKAAEALGAIVAAKGGEKPELKPFEATEGDD